jgi:hypothetical protein
MGAERSVMHHASGCERMRQAEYASIDAELADLMAEHDDGTITRAGRIRAYALFKRLLQAYAANLSAELTEEELIEEAS